LVREREREKKTKQKQGKKNQRKSQRTHSFAFAFRAQIHRLEKKRNGQIQGRVRHRDIERDLEQG
jgi:hypothetical protein